MNLLDEEGFTLANAFAQKDHNDCLRLENRAKLDLNGNKPHRLHTLIHLVLYMLVVIGSDACLLLLRIGTATTQERQEHIIQMKGYGVVV